MGGGSKRESEHKLTWRPLTEGSKRQKNQKNNPDILIRSSISRLPEISPLLGHAVHTPLAPSLSLSLSCTHTPERMPFVSCQRARPALLILSSLILFSVMCRPTQSCGRLPWKDVIHTNIYTCSVLAKHAPGT